MALTEERKLLLLGLLRQNDMHGYLLNAHLDGVVPIPLKKPTAYNLLDRMEQDGWIRHRDEPTGDRPRRVFSLTERGDRAFRDLLAEQLRSFRPAQFPSAVALTFLGALPPREALAHLQQRRTAVKAFRDQLEPAPGDGDDAARAHDDALGGATHVAVTYALRFAELELEVLDEIIADLSARAGDEEAPA
jgi:DNA-binding PadR family transcriptional regulator